MQSSITKAVDTIKDLKLVETMMKIDTLIKEYQCQ